MKRYLTFVIAEIAAVGTYVALAILVTHLILLIGPKRFPSEQFYRVAILYDGLPVALLCGLLGGLIVRGKPVAFGVVLALIVHSLAVLATPSLARHFHFWIETLLALAAAICGAVLATLVMSRLGKRDPIRPVWAASAGLLVVVFTWAVTIFVTKSIYPEL